MPEYLVGISYHEPGSFSRWRSGVAEDYETTTGLWVVADTPEEAVAWGERVGEALHRSVNRDPTAHWSDGGYESWSEASPAASAWGHCLDFFQRVRVGEMPPLERMTTEAFGRWKGRRA